MAKIAKELSALEVGRLRAPGLHAVGGVAGLYLQVTHTGARSWVLRAVVGAKRRDIGLGGFPSVTLAGAREAARAAREKIAAGIDPVEQRRAAKNALIVAQSSAKTFEQCTAAYLAEREAGWKNAKHRAQWQSTLETYAFPVIGKIPARDIGLPHVLDVLRPIWTEKTETASRLRGRIESVLDWARVSGYRTDENPARWRGHLEKILLAPAKVAKVTHHVALPIDQVGAFMRDLRAQAGVAAKALEFTILTAARSGEVRGATWGEIDLDAATWTVPAERMKAGREHRVALSRQALELLASMGSGKPDEIVFKAPRGGAFSDMALTAVLRRMNVAAVPHGFRSSFRDWAAERTAFPGEVAEMALAHAIPNQTEASYRRGDLLEKRYQLSQAWADFCDQVQPVKGTKVTAINRKRA